MRDYNPPHCEGFEAGEIPPGYKIPCGDGKEGNNTKGNYLVYSLFTLPIYFATPVVLTVTMSMCYRKVLQNEKKALNYGANQIRQSIALNARQQADMAATGRRASMMNSFRSTFSNMVSYFSEQTSMQRSLDLQKSRLVFYRAVSYGMAYVLCYGLMTFLIIFRLTGVILKVETSNSLYLAHAILSPLQGFFNFLIFLHPKVLNHKRKRKLNLSWTGAIMKALKSRGSKPKHGMNSATKTTSKGLRSSKMSTGLRASMTTSIRNVRGSVRFKKRERLSSRFVNAAIDQQLADDGNREYERGEEQEAQLSCRVTKSSSFGHNKIETQEEEKVEECPPPACNSRRIRKSGVASSVTFSSKIETVCEPVVRNNSDVGSGHIHLKESNLKESEAFLPSMLEDSVPTSLKVTCDAQKMESSGD